MDLLRPKMEEPKVQDDSSRIGNKVIRKKKRIRRMMASWMAIAVIGMLMMIISLLPAYLLALPRREAANNHQLLAADTLTANDQLDPSTMLHDEPLASAAASSSGFHCEPINLELCSHMAWKSTRWPNFFADPNQIEAHDREPKLKQLVDTKCSALLHIYVCELLTPVCLNEEATKRFEIYPCRSLCRRIRKDCELEIRRLFGKPSSNDNYDAVWPNAFACENLPFESNDGNGTLRGPCHDEPTESQPNQQQQQPTHTNVNQPTQVSKQHYWPYQPALDSNGPSFITDTSRIDSILIKMPVAGFRPADFEQPRDKAQQPHQQRPATNQHQQQQTELASDKQPTGQQQQNQGPLAQLYSIGQSFVWALARYSNLLSILTVLCLLAALFSKRLGRLKTYLSFSPANSTRSSSSSSSSRRQLQTKNHLQQQKQKQQQIGISPSASARSLMLIAGANSKQPPIHKLLPVEPPELLQGLASGVNKKTLINVSGTLERQLRQQHLNNTTSNNNNNRYLFMQANSVGKQRNGLHNGNSSHLAFGQHNNNNNNNSDQQQLFSSLDSQSSQSNQYDYIQVGSRAPIEMPNDELNLPSSSCPYGSRAHEQQLYSNILLSSPSHQVLLLSHHQQTDNNNHNHTRGPSFNSQHNQPTCNNNNNKRTTQQQQQQLAAARGHAPYSSTDGGSHLFAPDDLLNQRSFQRRTRQHSISAAGASSASTGTGIGIGGSQRRLTNANVSACTSQLIRLPGGATPIAYNNNHGHQSGSSASSSVSSASNGGSRSSARSPPPPPLSQHQLRPANWRTVNH